MAEGSASVKARGIYIRTLREASEMRIGVDLQKLVWGYADIDTVPDQMFIVASESGGQVLGAFNEDKPYNQFILEQLAADQLPEIKFTDERMAALGFLTVGERFANVKANQILTIREGDGIIATFKPKAK